MGLDHEQIVESGKFRASYRQYYKGVKVETGLMNIAGDKGVTYIANGSLLTGLDINTSYTVSEDSALITALDFYNGGTDYPWNDSEAIANYREEVEDSTATLSPPHGHLIIVKLRGDSLENIPANYKRCWQFFLNFGDSVAAKDVYVDAQSNTIYTQQDAMKEWSTHVGTGWTPYDGWYNNLFTSKRTIGTMYWLQDLTRNITTKYKSGSGAIWKDNNNDWVESSSKTAASAQWGVSRAFDYFWFIHGQAGMNAKWGAMEIHTDVDAASLPENNAGYTYDVSRNIDVIGLSPDAGGQSMAMLDVMGHEYTHGVIRNTSGFGNNPYDWDAASLSEAFCDIFGHSAESFARGWSDWSVGENFGIKKRSLSDPYNDKGDKYSLGGKSADYYLHPTLWESIAGFGKYSNGGVMRKWFKFLSEGGTIWHPTTGVTTTYTGGLGLINSSKLAYVGMRWWFWNNITYPQAAQQLVNHAIANYGRCSREHKLTARILRSLGFSNIASFFCYDDVIIIGDRTLLNNANAPMIAMFKVKQNNDNNDDSGDPRAGTYFWTLPDGWGGIQSGDSLVVNSFANYESQKLKVTFTSTDSSVVLMDSIVVHFSDEVWVPTDTNANSQYRISPNNTAAAAEEKAIRLYPNPANNTIELKLSDMSHPATVIITDIMGNQVMKSILTNFTTRIDVSNIPSGNYIVNIEQNQNRTKQKLTIKH
jgi:Zn-dependent metalloprotease